MGKILVFHHIPKTAGTTIYSILEKQYHEKRRFRMDGMNPLETLNQFMEIDKLHLNNLELIYGHLADHLLPVLENNEIEYHKLIFLREPIDHFVSRFNYIKRAKWNKSYDEVSQMQDIDEYCDFVQGQNSDNIQLRHLIGDTQWILNNEHAKNKIGNREFQYAKQVIDSFHFVFFVDLFDESILHLKEQLKWGKFPFYFIRNKTQSRQKVTSLSSRQIDRIKKLNQYDIMLYEYARNKNKELIKRFYSPRFRMRLSLFIFINKLYSNLYRIANL